MLRLFSAVQVLELNFPRPLFNEELEVLQARTSYAAGGIDFNACHPVGVAQVKVDVGRILSRRRRILEHGIVIAVEQFGVVRVADLVRRYFISIRDPLDEPDLIGPPDT